MDSLGRNFRGVRGNEDFRRSRGIGGLHNRRATDLRLARARLPKLLEAPYGLASREASRCWTLPVSHSFTSRETMAEADIAKVLNFDEARRIALNLAKLPRPLRTRPLKSPLPSS